MHLVKNLIPGCLIALLASPLCVLAQTAGHAHSPSDAKLVHGLLQAQEDKKHAVQDAARTTSVAAERLIAASTYDNYRPDSIMGIADTEHYYYNSSVRGSTFNYNSLSFHSEWIYGQYDYSYYRTITTLEGGIVSAASPNYFAQVQCDSSREYYSSGADTSGHHYIITDTLTTYETYNSSNNITFFDGYLASFNHVATAFAWDSYGNNTESVYLNYMTSTDTQGADIHIFNGAGQLVEDSIVFFESGALRPAERVLYTYDGAGNLVHASDFGDSLGTWLEYSRWDMTYNAANFLETDSFSIRISGTGTWVGDHSDSFGYTTGDSYYTSERINTYNDSTYSIVNGRQVYTKHVNAAGKPDTLYFSATGFYTTAPQLFAPAYKTAFIYDAYGNPVTSYQYFYTITDTATAAGYYDLSPDFTYHYYYETTSGVTNLAAAEKITIFPNPSAGLYTLAVSGRAYYTKAAVYNQMGQQVYERSFTGASGQLDLTAQPNGIYLVQITDESGAVLKTEKLVKTE